MASEPLRVFAVQKNKMQETSTNRVFPKRILVRLIKKSG